MVRFSRLFGSRDKAQLHLFPIAKLPKLVFFSLEHKKKPNNYCQFQEGKKMLTRSRKRKRDMRLEPSELVRRPSRIPTRDELQEWRVFNEEYCSEVRTVACTMMAKDLVDITVAYVDHEFLYQQCEENLKTGIRGRFFFYLNRWFHRGKMTFEKYCYLSNYVRGITAGAARHTRGFDYFCASDTKEFSVRCTQLPGKKQIGIKLRSDAWTNDGDDLLVRDKDGRLTTKRLEREGRWYSSFAELMRELSSSMQTATV
jgi:hypothetical protein